MKRKLILLGISLLLLIVVGACSNETETEVSLDQKNDETMIENVSVDGNVKEFSIEAMKTHWMLNVKLNFIAWTFNGTLPGNEIRVQEGEKVVLNVKNSLSTPTVLHLHGFPVSNEMDGVPGVTQNAIMPGEEFSYEYTADVPGTYWYHSHQNGAEQIGNGLYGVFIVEPKNGPTYDLDEVIVIDEFSTMMLDMPMNMEVDHTRMNMDQNMEMGVHVMDMDEEAAHTETMNVMYDTIVINGKAEPDVETIVVTEGDKIKLRFLNAGLFTQVVIIPEHSFKITHLDGQLLNEPTFLTEESFRIGPGERYDVEIDLNQPGSWGIQVFAEANKDNLDILIPLVYKGYENQELQTVKATSYFDFTTYGKSKKIDLGEITKEYEMLLGTNDGGESFGINGKQFPKHEIYEVEEGDVVKFAIINKTDVDHPMHLHREIFYVVSRNGTMIQGSPILKDTLNVRPDETYEIVFKANNPGNWLFHCHELHHAGGGMVAEMKYQGYKPKFTPDPNTPNQPE
ncbi:multicopper oxidase family protein [Anaerobacillus sp. MEB173]|uniref:multicopper oxidase family protein n=1 Tax=Anaerobacillus sp. MEB173 TaxID=3383345 RepID=UPI003F922B31